MGRKIKLDENLIGQRFGKLTIVGFTTVERGRQKCICKCECGNTTLANLKDLTTGHKKSCGCIRVNALDKYNYLIGQKINKWTVLELSNSGRICYATCICECGTIKNVNVYNLLNNKTKDCGCGRKKMLSETRSGNLIGKHFGKLTVVDKLPETNKFNRVLYKCKCECGNEIIVPSNSLSSGHTISCGCINSYYNMYIGKLLNDMQVTYNSEYCVNIKGHKLRFDFYLPEYNLFIEYDGEQHYMPINFGKWNDDELDNRFQTTQKYDQFKNEYCDQHNINLLRIPYWDKQNIEEIIYNHLQRLSEKGFAA